MISAEQLSELKDTSLRMRYELIKMMGFGKVHHFGGSLSVVEIMTALYFYKLRIRPDDPEWYERDRFVMSKGHSVPAQYVALALKGIIPMESLKTLKSLGSILQGHPNSWMTPGIEACTGSLGQGLSFGNGVALCAKIKKIDSRVYVVMGDGELHEGQIWEAAMTTTKQCLTNVVAIIDRNRLKAMDETACGKSLDPLPDRWATFGWAVREIDGHDLAAICDALDWATEQDRPAAIVANTVKGKGVSIFEGQAKFHNAAVTEAQLQQALTELKAAMAEEA